MNYSLEMVQDLYRMGTQMWIDKITNATDIRKLAEEIYHVNTFNKMDWGSANQQFEIKLIEEYLKEGATGIERLARCIVIHYLGCRYAPTKEIENWLNEELRRVDNSRLVWNGNGIVYKPHDPNEVKPCDS